MALILSKDWHSNVVLVTIDNQFLRQVRAPAQTRQQYSMQRHMVIYRDKEQPETSGKRNFIEIIKAPFFLVAVLEIQTM